MKELLVSYYLIYNLAILNRTQRLRNPELKQKLYGEVNI